MEVSVGDLKNLPENLPVEQPERQAITQPFTCNDISVHDPSLTVHDPKGHVLVDQVLTLTGIPESLMRLELDQILENSGQSSQNLTLDQLRQALVAHLEAMQADFMGENTEVFE